MCSWRVYKAETDKQPSFVWARAFAAHRNAARHTHSFTVTFTHIPGVIAPLSPIQVDDVLIPDASIMLTAAHRNRRGRFISLHQ